MRERLNISGGSFTGKCGIRCLFFGQRGICLSLPYHITTRKLYQKSHSLLKKDSLVTSIDGLVFRVVANTL